MCVYAPAPTHPSSLLLLFFGAFLLIFGLTSFLIRGRFFLTTAPLALVCGVALGPRGYAALGGWDVDPDLYQFTRIVLGIQVLSAGVTLPSKLCIKSRMRDSLLVLLGPVMLSAVVISGLFAKALFPSLSWLEAFVVGGCLAPTDPVLAASVVKGTFAERHVPPFIRDLLLASETPGCESGINDGAATPFLMIPLLLITSQTPVKEYIVTTILRETILGIVGGFALGTIARIAWDAADRRRWIDKESRLVWTIALAIFTTGLFNLMGSGELLACYFCGTAMNWNGHLHEDDLHSHFSEGIDALLDVAVFTTLGTALPWDQWHDRDSPMTLWRLALFGIAVLALRRLPSVFLLQRAIPEIRSMREAGFVGWFGPMGVGALYFALKSGASGPSDCMADDAAEHASPESVLKQQLFTIVSWVVFLSTLVHGAWVSPLGADCRHHRPALRPRLVCPPVLPPALPRV
ncbi:Cation/H+ exchanger [Papiliotrema laurentii]|uniref:Cation/H+ exchanger n=1 Tax=Papiliotrema laurentii TaxID=5418 RepID=A0AAD9FPX2_PAPLA|nr:Cation/H+ exchanger [Papiliotrema laurentii]